MILGGGGAREDTEWILSREGKDRPDNQEEGMHVAVDI